MDEIGDYLSRLRKELKGISDSEREDITAEIRSHIEDGLQDPRTGASERQRRPEHDGQLMVPALDLMHGVDDERAAVLDLAPGPGAEMVDPDGARLGWARRRQHPCQHPE